MPSRKRVKNTITRNAGGIGSVGEPIEASKFSEEVKMETISNTPESVAVPDVGTRFINDDNERLDDDVVLALHLSAISPGASVEEKIELLKAIPGGDVPSKAASVFPSNELVPVVKRRPNRHDFWRGINAVWTYSTSLGVIEIASLPPGTSLAEFPSEKVDEDGND